jgi:peroxiredoxin
VITKWGVDDYGKGIARPATFVVEQGGAISYRKVGEKASDHPSIDELLAAMER